MCTVERQLASWGTITEGLEESVWIGREMVAMLTKIIVLSTW